MTLLTQFKERLLDYCQDLAWKHWTKLGVQGRAEADAVINVDPEALVLFTGFLSHIDLRLVDHVLEWLISNENLIFKSRLKKILEIDHALTLGSLVHMFDRLNAITGDARWDSLAKQCLEQKKNLVEHDHKESSSISFKSNLSEYDTVNAQTDNNRIFLRKLFGPSVRAEVLNFLVAGGENSSNAMAKFLSISQSSVYTRLQDLVDIGIVQKKDHGRLTNYRLGEGRFVLHGLQQEKFFDWTDFFRAIILSWREIEKLQEADTDYKERSVLNTFNETFWASLSGWNLSYTDYLSEFHEYDLLEMDNPEDHLLDHLTSLPHQVMNQIFPRV